MKRFRVGTSGFNCDPERATWGANIFILRKSNSHSRSGFSPALTNSKQALINLARNSSQMGRMSLTEDCMGERAGARPAQTRDAGNCRVNCYRPLMEPDMSQLKARFASNRHETLKTQSNRGSLVLGIFKAKGAPTGQANHVPHAMKMNTTTPGTHDRLLAQLAAIPACQESFEEADWFPPVDILEDTEEYLFKIDLPDVKAENIQVTVEEDRMVISGERPNPWLADRKHLRVERPHGHFERRFALPDDASRQEISTLFAENVLEVHVRKVSPPAETPVATSASPRLKLHSPS